MAAPKKKQPARVGRPALPPGERRSESLLLRMTKDERLMLDIEAERRDMDCATLLRYLVTCASLAEVRDDD